MGAAYEKKLGKPAAQKLGRKIYKEARKLEAGEKLPSLAPKLKARHTTDIYAGMERRQGESRFKTEYTTYRTISENSPADAWIYPARPGSHIIDKMLDEAKEDVRDAVSEVLGGILVEVQMKKIRQRGSTP